MATYKHYSIDGVMPINGGKAGLSKWKSQHLSAIVNITAWGIGSLAGCAGNNGIAMKQGAEVTMHR
jgi:hypothetical protein